MSFLGFDDVNFQYNADNVVFKELSFRLERASSDRGYCIALMGSSGSGKTTLLKLLLGTLKPQAGCVLIKSNAGFASYVPQEPVLFNHLTPLQNAKYFSRIGFYKNRYDEKTFEELMQVLGMEEVLRETKSVEDLSGGQKQRIMLLRALSVNPDILMMDEPTNGLDSIVKINFLQSLRRILTQRKILVLYVTHHRLESQLIADKVAYLEVGSGGRSTKLHQKELQVFIQEPPVLDAARMFDYPTANILYCRQISKGVMLDNDQLTSSLKFALRQHNLCVSRQNGFFYHVLSTNPIYTSIEVQGQILTLKTTEELLQQGNRIELQGKLLCYGADDRLEGLIDVANVNFINEEQAVNRL